MNHIDGHSKDYNTEGPNNRFNLTQRFGTDRADRFALAQSVPIPLRKLSEMLGLTNIDARWFILLRRRGYAACWSIRRESAPRNTLETNGRAELLHLIFKN